MSGRRDERPWYVKYKTALIVGVVGFILLGVAIAVSLGYMSQAETESPQNQVFAMGNPDVPEELALLAGMPEDIASLPGFPEDLAPLPGFPEDLAPLSVAPEVAPALGEFPRMSNYRTEPILDYRISSTSIPGRLSGIEWKGYDAAVHNWQVLQKQGAQKRYDDLNL